MKSIVDVLCSNCGLCCDSTLFVDVKLRPDDDAKQLAQLGLALTKKGRGKSAFLQPCKCFDGKHCKIYGDRPVQCRAFECGLLKRVAGGEISVDKALKSIYKAKKVADRVRRLLRAFGQCPEEKPMAHCYSEAMAGPIDLSGGPANAKRHGKLMQAYGDLTSLLERDFLQ
jgi:Fe-S-cluster containining protein